MTEAPAERDAGASGAPAGPHPVLVGLAGLVGALVAGVLGALAGGAVWEATHPDAEGFAGLAALVVGLLAGAAASYPGALVGVWLAVRRRPGAGRTVAWAALLYPLVAIGPLMEAFGLASPGGVEWFWLCIPLAFVGCALAGVIGGRRSRDAGAGSASSR